MLLWRCQDLMHARAGSLRIAPQYQHPVSCRLDYISLQDHGPCTEKFSSSQECSSCRILCGVAIGYGVCKRAEGAHCCIHRQASSYTVRQHTAILVKAEQFEVLLHKTQ